MHCAEVIGVRSAAGVEAVVTNYCRSDRTGRNQYDFIIDEGSLIDYPADMLERGCRYIVVPSSEHPISRMLRLTSLFRKNHYDLVHAHMNTLNALVLFPAWLARVPRRISHNHSTMNRAEGARGRLKNILRHTAAWFATDKVSCGELAGRWIFGGEAFERGEVRLLYNAIDLDKYRFRQDNRDWVRKTLGLGDRLVVGHVGRFAEQKNHMFLLSVFDQIHRKRKDAALLLLGDGKLRPVIEREITRRGLRESVILMGNQTNVVPFYSAMDVLVLPSFYEGVPVVGVEAQANGLPCVMADTISREVDATGGVSFLPLDAGAEAWADQALKVCPANARRAERGDRMRGGRYDIDASAALWADLYRTRATSARG